MDRIENITIVGAGLCGLILSLFLARRGFNVHIYERNKSTHHHLYQKSIDLDLSIRALKTLEALGLKQQVLKFAIPTIGRLIAFSDDEVLSLPHGPIKKNKIYNIERKYLYHVLLSEVKKHKSIKMHFSHQLIQIEKEMKLHRTKDILIFKDSRNRIIKIVPDFVIAADGASSIVRGYLHKMNKVSIKEKSLGFYYKTIFFPQQFFNDFNSSYMYKWLDRKQILLNHPRHHGEFSSIFLYSQARKKAISQFITRFKIFSPVSQTFQDQFEHNYEGTLQSINVKQRMNNIFLLMGDSAHTMYPFLGQGINCTFEDCYLFYRFLIKSKNNLFVAKKDYLAKRQKEIDAIMKMSEVEYPELTSDIDEVYLYESLKKDLAKTYPKDFIPYRYLLYFTTLPYDEIRTIQLEQMHILKYIHKL